MKKLDSTTRLARKCSRFRKNCIAKVTTEILEKNNL